jgi:polyisoprenoid-binding protein YceI
VHRVHRINIYLLSLALVMLPWARVVHAQTSSQKISVHLDAAQSQIYWTLGGTLHTVHGTFKLKGGLITFDPVSGVAQGEVLVDLITGESGNHDRDRKMQKDVLESEKYPQAIFHPTKVSGIVKAGTTQNVTVEGTFTIHGADHPLKLDVKVQLDGNQATATTNFLVPYVAWGMKDPSALMLRVGKQVNVDVSSKGTIEGLE